MIPVGTSSQLQVEILNSDQLLLSAAGSEEITTRVMAATVVRVAAVHFRVALQDQELWVKETQAVTPMVAEVVLLVVVAALVGHREALLACGGRSAAGRAGLLAAGAPSLEMVSSMSTDKEA